MSIQVQISGCHVARSPARGRRLPARVGVSASDLAIVLNLRRATGSPSLSLCPSLRLSAASFPHFICFKQTTAKCRKSFACAASLPVCVCVQGVCECECVNVCVDCACLDGFVDLWPDCKCIKCQRKHCNLLLLNPAQTPPKWSAEATTLCIACCPYKCHAHTGLPSVSVCVSVCVAGVLAFVLISHTLPHTHSHARRLIVVCAVSELCF